MVSLGIRPRASGTKWLWVVCPLCLLDPPPYPILVKRGWGSCGCSLHCLDPAPLRPRVMNQKALRAISFCGWGRECTKQKLDEHFFGGAEQNTIFVYLCPGADRRLVVSAPPHQVAT